MANPPARRRRGWLFWSQFWGPFVIPALLAPLPLAWSVIGVALVALIGPFIVLAIYWKCPRWQNWTPPP